jgi:hypothetical protein
MYIKLWSVNLEGKDHLGDLHNDREIIFKWILRIQDVRMWTEFKWLRIETEARLL